MFLLVFLFTMLFDVGEAALRGSVWSDLPYLISMGVWAAAVIAALVSRERRVERLVAWFFLITVLAFALSERSTFQG